jgi:hypothetical protein
VERHGKSNCDVHFSALSRFLKQASKQRKLSSVDDIIECISDCQLNANLNKELLFRDSKHPISLYCFKVNPPILNTRDERRLVPEIKTFAIPGIRNYYNLVANLDGEIKTQLNGLGKTKYELLCPGTYGNVQSSFSYKGPQIVKKKVLNIDQNCRKRKLFFKRLTKKKTIYANITENDSTIPTSSQETSINICKNVHENEKCNKNCKFQIDQIDKQTVAEIKEELFIHGHKKSLFIKVKKRQRNKEEAVNELKQHYKSFHLKK